MTQATLLDIAPYQRTRLDSLMDIAEKMGHDIQVAGGIAEPGYDDKPVVLGNWNERYTGNVITDNTMPRLAALFEKLGYTAEWSDEWEVCSCCGKVIRVRADSYSWKAYYWIDPVHCELLCGDCIKDDPAGYLEYLSGNPSACDTIGLDLSKFGYELHAGNYENGWYPGQNDDPKDVAIKLRKEGIEDFVFVLDNTGQFDIGFSVWVKR